MINVSQGMIEEASAETCRQYILKVITYCFSEHSDMQVCADKGGVTLLSFSEVAGRPPLHQYEIINFLDLQMEGEAPRVKLLPPSPWLNTAVLNLVTERTGRTVAKLRVETEEEANMRVGGTERGVEKEEESTDAVSKAVSGAHYNDVVPGYQYMEMMQHMLEGKEGVEAHLLGQTYKYLMRSGKKDDVEQEYRKARWYLNCLVKFKQTGEIDPNNND